MEFSSFINLVVIVVIMYYIGLAPKTGKTIYLINAIIVGSLVFLVLNSFNMAYKGIVYPSSNDSFNRSYYVVDNNKLYNENTLDSKIFSSLPSSEQIIDNIPACMASKTNQINNYLKAYDKVYKYIVSTRKYSNKDTIGITTKATLDYNYNYHKIRLFREIYNTKIADSRYNSVADLINPIWARKYGNKETLANILNKNFDEQEQLELADETLSIYKQAGNNCVQSGYGQEFWSVFWSLSSPAIIGSKEDIILDMQKSLIVVPEFAKNEKIHLDYKHLGKLTKVLALDKSINLDVKSYIIMSVLVGDSLVNRDLMTIAIDWSYMEVLGGNESSHIKTEKSLKKLNNQYFEVAKYYKQLLNYTSIVMKGSITDEEKLELERNCQAYINIINKTNLKEYLKLRSYLVYRLFIAKQVCEVAQGLAKDVSYYKDFKKYYK